MSRSIVCTLILFIVTCSASEGAAQDTDAPDRGGFTLLLNLGVGYQNDQALSGSELGIGGLNLGIGGFLTDDLALMFRTSGTNVKYTSVWQVSGVAGPVLQYWVNDRVSIDGGFGVGFWDVAGASESGPGLILGSKYSFYNRGKHNLHVGIEYAPAFTDPETVHNLGFVFGWQLQ